jgi:hypothetical protein
MGALDENGQWISITEKAREVAEQRAAERENRPANPQPESAVPTKTDPGPQPDVDVVDEFWVESVGQKSLPDSADLTAYRNGVAEGVYRKLADQIVDASGIDLTKWANGIAKASETVAAASEALGKKDEPELPASEQVEFEPLPGVNRDEVCTSTFDVNDLALRGHKALSSRRYNQPLVLFDAVLPTVPEAHDWRFGQKLEYQQEWRHEGFTLGELISSMSMLPGEEVNIEVSSFQRTKTEIQKESDSTTRQQLELEQKNTDERSCTNAAAASSGWSVSASASVSYPVASASLSASAYGNSSERSEQNRRQLAEATSRAVSDLSSRRAVKITQTTEAGSESTTTRRLRNPNPCQSVTFNFFQVIKLYDVQLRLLDDRPTLLLPGLFPLFYGPQMVRKVQTADVRPTEVAIPVHLVEGWNSPAVFLTQYFEVDRELSQQISGWALRLRADFGADAGAAARQLSEGLIVAAQFLFKVDPTAVLKTLTDIFRNYVTNIAAARTRAAASYGPDKGRSEQLNTSGVYLDALRGRCTACTDHEESGHYVEIMTALEELRRLKSANELDAAEAERRHKLLEAKQLGPFEPAVTAPVVP